MKTIVSCPHCNAKYKTLTDHVPDYGRPAPCPLCGQTLILWKPDEYYLENVPLEIATFLLFRKQTFPNLEARLELERIIQLKEWLNEQHKTLSNATSQDLRHFLNLIAQSQSQESCQQIRQTLQQFYAVLAQKNYIANNPLPQTPDDRPTGVATPPSLPTKPLKKLLAVTGVLLLMAVIWLSRPFFNQPAPQQTVTTPTKIIATEEAPPPAKEDPQQAASRKTEAEIDRWAQEVVKRAEMIQQADRAILQIRKGKEPTKPKQTTQKTATSQCLSGDCRNGIGTFHFDNGDTYTGDWHNGRRHGTGTLANANQEKYVGDWRNDQMEGKGTFHYLDGTTYTGEWLNNQRHGKGTLTQPNGDKYVGTWRNDKKFGTGTKHLIFADHLAKKQSKHIVETQRAHTEQEQESKKLQDQLTIAQALEQGKKGCIQGNCEKGKGVYIYASGDYYSGDWLNGDKHGQGSYIFKSGDSYSGSWHQNKKHGQGTYRFKSGQRYDGGWWLNKKHGPGTISFPNGLRIRNQWDNGEQVQN